MTPSPEAIAAFVEALRVSSGTAGDFTTDELAGAILTALPDEFSPDALRAENERLREALEQTNEALIVARRLSPTRRGPDFPGDPPDMVYHGNIGHGPGMACEVCDYDAAFDALLETNRAALAQPEPPAPKETPS